MGADKKVTKNAKATILPAFSRQGSAENVYLEKEKGKFT